MAVNLGNAFHYFIPLLLCLAGFQGVLLYSTPWKKTTAWCAFQAGLVVFLLQLGSPENSIPLALALLALTATVATGVLLALFCVKLVGRPKFSEAGKNARRGSK